MESARPMLLEAWERFKALSLALAVHLLAAALIILGTRDWRPFKPPVITGMSIEAVIVDTQALRERQETARREAEAAALREQRREQRQRELAAQQERERQRAEAERQAELQRQREEAERKRQAELRLKQLRERQERERQEQLERQQREMEELRAQREKIERQRKIEEERLKQLEARREAEAAAQRQAEAEAALRQQMAAEQQAGRIATLRDQYIGAIQAQVTNNWLRPPTARAGLRCTLRIVQIPGGEVISANIRGSCNGDEATRRSLVAAVERAGSLPYRGFEEVFEREIDFIFRYDGD
jgi:colicin import membrane protein